MYFSMDEIGFENSENIKKITSESGRWKFIHDIAQAYGFEGVHFTPSLYNGFGLELNNIPDYFSDFRLTFHFGGYSIATAKDYEIFDKEMEKAFEISLRHNMHDVSVHPPYVNGLTRYERDLCRDLFHRAITKWLKLAADANISLSLETHVAGEWFLFDGLGEYVEFIDIYPDLGVLIDISHNYYQPEYSEDDIINILGDKNIKGLHISDSLRSAEFQEGTHLPIGDGTINFTKLLKCLCKFPDLYGVLEIKSSNEGINGSLKKLRKIIS